MSSLSALTLSWIIMFAFVLSSLRHTLNVHVGKIRLTHMAAHSEWCVCVWPIRENECLGIWANRKYLQRENDTLTSRKYHNMWSIPYTNSHEDTRIGYVRRQHTTCINFICNSFSFIFIWFEFWFLPFFSLLISCDRRREDILNFYNFLSFAFCFIGFLFVVFVLSSVEFWFRIFIFTFFFNIFFFRLHSCWYK